MKKLVSVLAMLFTGAIYPVIVTANHLPAPTGLVCPVVDVAVVVDGVIAKSPVIAADWDDVVGSTKYSVDVVAGYDTLSTGVVDTTLDFAFGTSDRTDGLAMSVSSLTIPIRGLATDFVVRDAAGVETVVTLAPDAVALRVKTLHPGRGQGPQNSVFSDFCRVDPSEFNNALTVEVTPGSSTP